MIDRITIEGFQRVAQRTITPSPGVTVLTGPNGSGKSSTLRALRWLCTNTPKGFDYLRWGSSEASVTLDIDGHTVTRRRSKTANVYELDGQVYADLREGVPPAVARVLNVSPLNFQTQHDATFWFFDSAGEVSRQLNSIVSLDRIDAVLSYFASMIKRESVTRDVHERQRDEAAALIDSLAWVEQADADLTAVEEAERLHAVQATETARLAAQVAHAKELSIALQTASERKADSLELMAAIDRHEEARKGYGYLCERLSKIRRLQADLESLTRERGRLADSLREAASSLCPTCGKLMT